MISEFLTWRISTVFLVCGFCGFPFDTHRVNGNKNHLELLEPVLYIYIYITVLLYI